MPSAEETLGDAGRYADPDDGAAWARAVLDVLDHREALSKAAKTRFERIGWDWPQIAEA